MFVFLVSLTILWLTTIKTKENQGRIIFGVVVFLLFSLLMGASKNVSDYSVYQTWYQGNSSGSSDKEFIYFGLSRLFNYIGISYKSFRLFTGLVFAFFLMKGVSRFGVNTNKVLLLYFIYPFIMDAVQVRFALGVVLVLNAVGVLYEHRDKWLLYAILYFVAACGCQSIFLLYIPILLLVINNKKTYFRYIIALIILVEIVVSLFFRSALVSISELIVGGTGSFDERVGVYLNEIGTTWKPLVFVLGYLIVFYLEKKMSNKLMMANDIESIKRTHFVDNYYLFYLIMMIYAPLVVINSNFFRVFRSTILVSLIIAIWIIDNPRIRATKSKYMFEAYIIFYAVFNFVIKIYNENGSNIFIPFFNDNWILDLFL